MTEQVRFGSFINEGAQRAGATYRYAARQPSWIMRAVTMTVLLIIAIPIFLLVMFALLCGAIVFAVLYGVHAIASGIRNLFPGSDGRENVRIVRREES